MPKQMMSKREKPTTVLGALGINGQAHEDDEPDEATPALTAVPDPEPEPAPEQRPQPRRTTPVPPPATQEPVRQQPVAAYPSAGIPAGRSAPSYQTHEPEYGFDESSGAAVQLNTRINLVLASRFEAYVRSRGRGAKRATVERAIDMLLRSEGY